MQSLEAACDEAEKIIEKVKTCSLPLNRPQDLHENLVENENSSKPTFSLFEKLEELYREECAKDLESNSNQSFKIDSFLLEKLVARERLNTLILNLYPEKNEFSFALRMGSIVDDINIGNNIDKASNTLNDDGLIKMHWDFEHELLRCIDNEELPCIITDILEQEHSELFYSGCIIVEVRDYHQTNSQVLCETHHVLLRPTTQSLMADLNVIMSKTAHDWSEDDMLLLESELTNTINPTLCLEPSPLVCIANNRVRHQRQLFGTLDLQKRAQRFCQASRKRKLEPPLSARSMELFDFISKKRLRSTKNASNSLSKMRTPRMVLPAPSLEIKKPLAVPENVNTSKFRSYIGPRDTKNCMPHLVEEYVFYTDRQCERDRNKSYRLHIRLSILQRPFNSEYLGEIYLDVDYEEGKSNGASSRFTLGSRSYVDKFMRQFIEMLTQKGRKSMNIEIRVPGQEPRYLCVPGFTERDKAVEAAQHAQVHAAQQAVQGAVGAGPQSVSGPSALANGTAAPSLVLVPTSPSSIIQQALQNNQPKLETRHSTNPEITALVASFISTAQQIEQEAAAAAAAKSAAAAAAAQAASTASASTAGSTASSNNAAILSLLNTTPVNSAATAAVANAITNNSNASAATVGTPQKLVSRKMTIANPRVLNHITVNNSAPAQQVRISALASQLTAPPVNVIIATANTGGQPPGQTFTLTTVGAAGFPTHVTYTVPLHTAAKPAQNQPPRLVAAAAARPLTAKPPTEGTTATVSGLSALLVNTPAADHPIPGANSASALLERLTAASAAVPSSSGGGGGGGAGIAGGASTPVGDTLLGAKQVPVQLAKTAAVASGGQAGPQTLNVHTLNLAPFNNLAGLQNVQVQIPRLSAAAAAPLNASSAANIIFSVAVTSSTATCSATPPSLAASATAPAVVIANNNAPGSTSPVLPLPIAQLVASGVKGLTQQSLRVASPGAAGAKSVQLVGALPRSAQLAGVKQQLAARGILQAQRLTTSALKMATSNASTAQMAGASLTGGAVNIAGNSVVTLSAQQQQQLQLTLQKQAQFPQFHSQNCLTQPPQKTVSPAAVASKHHRRSNAADPNK